MHPFDPTYPRVHTHISGTVSESLVRFISQNHGLHSVDLESPRYPRTPADYTWQLILAARVLPSLVYISSSRLTRDSDVFAWTHHIPKDTSVVLALGNLDDAPHSVAAGVTGLIAGHLWW
jgi:hypothetical protein